jgi:hypothetical protein
MRKIVSAIGILLSFVIPGTSQLQQPAIPQGVESLDILFPSDAIGGGTLALRLFAPISVDRSYFPEGAPIVIEVPGGDSAGSLFPPRGTGLEGFVYITFLFPGGRFENRVTAGSYDHRGLNSIKALRDVALFAAGLKQDSQGRTIDKILKIRPLANNLGLLTLSNGGSIAVVTLALYGEQLTNIQYMIDWENPSNGQVVTTDPGPGANFDCPPSPGRPNPASRPRYTNPNYRNYGPVALDIDYSRIAYEASTDRFFLDGNKNGKIDTITDAAGCRSPDLNRNGQLDADEDYLFSSMPYAAPGEKKHFSLQVLQAARDAKLFSSWPSTIDTPEESDKFWEIRDAARNYDALAKKRTDLKLMILASVVDHVQTVLGKPHIRQPFEAFRRNKMWVRLNPSPAQVTKIDARLQDRTDLPNNRPNSAPADWSNYSYAYPEGIPDTIFYAAAIREMAELVRSEANALPR